ncbi:MAG: trypsin-like peptidase domain-containing protein [Pseudomonadota bacterium]
MWHLWRRSSATVLMAAFLAVALGGPATSAEVSPTTLLDAEEAKPWRGVGRVNIANVRQRSMCTGTLIAPDLVLTAAHCVTHPRTNTPFPPGNVHFVAGWYQGKSTGHARADAVAIHPGWQGRQNMRLEGLESDLALIRLRAPLDAAAGIPFAITIPPLPGEPLTLISYRRDRPHALTHQPDCPYRAIIGQMLELECPVTYGASGAPVFSLADGTPRVVAVLSAMGGRGAAQAFAVRADRVIEELKALLPTP